jgi:fructose-1,6-bisphosphatase/inositol monophosphatase family enzyme
MAYVACGRLDATINNYTSMRDICAAGLLLEQTGGRWTLLDGTKPLFPLYNKFNICASNNNSSIHNQLLSRIIHGR